MLNGRFNLLQRARRGTGEFWRTQTWEPRGDHRTEQWKWQYLSRQALCLWIGFVCCLAHYCPRRSGRLSTSLSSTISTFCWPLFWTHLLAPALFRAKSPWMRSPSDRTILHLLRVCLLFYFLLTFHILFGSSDHSDEVDLALGMIKIGSFQVIAFWKTQARMPDDMKRFSRSDQKSKLKTDRLVANTRSSEERLTRRSFFEKMFSLWKYTALFKWDTILGSVRAPRGCRCSLGDQKRKSIFLPNQT